ncbi:MAG: hypothetical protein AAGC93_26315 [Cyanobacteria bacterium P01_F01_bin.53]
MMSSTIFYLLFSATVEEYQQKYSAQRAAHIATQYAIERIELAPRRVYPSSNISDAQFEKQFNKSFNGSNFYCFKGASAGFAIYRLRSPNAFDGYKSLALKTARFLLLDPRKEELLQEFAKSNLRSKVNEVNTFTQQAIKDEVDNVQKEIYMSILGVYHLRCLDILHDIDISFHDEFVFFRSEIFANGIFISYYNGSKTFPGSMYYDESSGIYQAYRRNFDFCRKKGERQFSLKGLSENKDITEILQHLNCKYSLNELELGIAKQAQAYSKKIN